MDAARPCDVETSTPPVSSLGGENSAHAASLGSRGERARPHAVGHLIAWISLWAVNTAFVLATFPPARATGIRVRHLLFDAGHMVAAGVLVSAVVHAWHRAAPRAARLGYLALGLVGVGVGAAVLRDDLAGLASRLPGPDVVWLALFVAAAGATISLSAAIGSLSTRSPWLAVPVVVASLGAAVGNELVLPNDYYGVHLFAAVLSATVIGTVLSRALARPIELAWARRSARVAGHAACATLGAGALVSLCWAPGSSVLVELLRVPGSVFAPFVAAVHERDAGTAQIPAASVAWFTDRSGAPNVAPSKPLVPAAPVVILFVVDCLRADVLEQASNAKSLPTMFALRDASVRFTRARTVAPATTQSVSAIMASKVYSQMYWTPVRNAVGAERVFAAQDPSARFPEILAAAGVPTILATPLAGLRNELGTARGFTEERVNSKLWAPAAEIAEDIVARLQTVGTGPAFLYTQVTDAHAPWPHSGPKGSPQAKYMRGLAKVDAAVAIVLRALVDLGLDERTVFVLTADHGEAFGEHGDRFHGHTIYDELLRVPLLFRVPGVGPRQVHELASLIDLGPTILDIFGRPIPGAFMGQSLVGLLRGEGLSLSRPVVAESTRHKRAMMFADGMKVIEDRRLNTIEVFDLNEDPGEQHNLFEDGARSRRGELALLRAYFTAHEFRRPGYTLPYQP